MKNIISKGCFLLVLITLLASCGSKKPAVMKNETIKTKTITETVHDTVFKIEADSSFYQALLDCQDGKVVVKSVVQSESGRNLKSPTVRIDNNKLEVDCEARAQELLAHYKSTHQTNEFIVTREVPFVTNVLTWWQQTQIKLFWLFAIILSLQLLWKFIKPKFF